MIYSLAKNCIITFGATNALLSDLQMQKNYLLSQELAKLLTDSAKLTVVCSDESLQLDKTLEEFLNNGVIISIPEEDSDCFVDLPLTFDIPSEIYNAIIDRDPTISPDSQKLCLELHRLRCRFIELRYYTNFEIGDVESILRYLEDSTVEMINVYIPFKSSQIELLTNLVRSHARLSSIFIHSTPHKLVKDYAKSHPTFIFTSQVINNEKHCGNISAFYFSTNIPTFSEAKNFNTCLYKKVGVDIHGNIKNCPSMNMSFGNVKDTSLIDVVQNSDFQRAWNITKDMISVCKACEFRYVCTDCRAYVETPQDIYSKPLKCGYNPYTGIWDNWDQMPEKLNATNYYFNPADLTQTH